MLRTTLMSVKVGGPGDDMLGMSRHQLQLLEEPPRVNLCGPRKMN